MVWSQRRRGMRISRWIVPLGLAYPVPTNAQTLDAGGHIATPDQCGPGVCELNRQWRLGGQVTVGYGHFSFQAGVKQRLSHPRIALTQIWRSARVVPIDHSWWHMGGGAVGRDPPWRMLLQTGLEAPPGRFRPFFEIRFVDPFLLACTINTAPESHGSGQCGTSIVDAERVLILGLGVRVRDYVT
jgi:hypothetical protein